MDTLLRIKPLVDRRENTGTAELRNGTKRGSSGEDTNQAAVAP